MKEGWKYEQMGNVCTFISGYTPAKELLSKSGSIPYYKVSDMNTEGNELLLYKTSLYLSNAKKIIPQGSVVFPKNGGAIFTNKKRMLVCDSVVDLNTEAIFPNKNIVTTNFLYKLLLSIDLGQFDNGGGLPSINIKKMQSFTIPIPPLPEQERIVSLLDAEFAKIDAIKANAEKQLQEAKALFQSILCNLLSNDSWTYSTIGEIFKTYSGGTPHKSNNEYYENGNIPWINSGEVCQKYIETTNNFITEKGLKNSSAKYYPVNTVLVAMYGATAAQSGILKFEATSNQAVCGLLPNKNYVPEFVYYWFVYNKEKVASMAQGGAQPNLSQVKIKTISIPLISLDDQQQIAEQLDKISAKIHSLQSNFDTTVTLCNDLKQSILKDIFG